MNIPASKHTFMVVMSKAGFFVADTSRTEFRETNASKNERAKLVRNLGLRSDGSLPGLLEEHARKIAVQMGNARRRSARNRRRA